MRKLCKSIDDQYRRPGWIMNSWMKFSRITGITMVTYQYWDDNHSRTHTHTFNFLLVHSSIPCVVLVCCLCAPPTDSPFMKNSKIEVESMMFLRSIETETCCSSMWVDVCVYGMDCDWYTWQRSKVCQIKNCFISHLSYRRYFPSSWLDWHQQWQIMPWLHVGGHDFIVIHFIHFGCFFVGFLRNASAEQVALERTFMNQWRGPTRVR